MKIGDTVRVPIRFLKVGVFEVKKCKIIKFYKHFILLDTGHFKMCLAQCDLKNKRVIEY